MGAAKKGFAQTVLYDTIVGLLGLRFARILYEKWIQSTQKGSIMSDQHDQKPMDKERRNLLIATGGVGALGAAAFAAPLVSSFAPSEKAKAAGAPVEIDISDIKPGEQKVAEWRGKPVWILRRTEEMTAQLSKIDDMLADPKSEKPFTMPLPEYCNNEFRCRADHKDVMVMVGECTHLGCSPELKLKPGGAQPDNWPGGYLCPCHGSQFDLAGRVFKNKPAPVNLDVPPYMFLSPTKIVIGKDEKGEA